MTINITRTPNGLTYEIDVPAEYDSRTIMESLSKQTENIEVFFEGDKELNIMQLCYD